MSSSVFFLSAFISDSVDVHNIVHVTIYRDKIYFVILYFKLYSMKVRLINYKTNSAY